MTDRLPELFDSHCHLTAPAFAHDLEHVLERAQAAGVGRWVTIGSDVEDSRAALALARRAGGWATAGCHPHEADNSDASTVGRIRKLATEPEVVAVGETGLDYHYGRSSGKTQRELFTRHLALGAELGLPVVVHARDADADVADAISKAPVRTLGVLHCFTGGARAFEAAMARDWYLSLSGIASFKNFAAADLVRKVSHDRLLIETDSPYLSPVPFRGRRNEPAHLLHVAEAVGRLLGMTVVEVARMTTGNALRFYGLNGDAAGGGMGQYGG